MSVYLYDDALLSKIKYWTEKTNLHVYGVDEIRDLFQVIADETKDKPIKLPILTVTRPKGYTILNTNKKPTTYNGIKVVQEEKTASMLAQVPINIQYQFDLNHSYLLLVCLRLPWLFLNQFLLSLLLEQSLLPF